MKKLKQPKGRGKRRSNGKPSSWLPSAYRTILIKSLLSVEVVVGDGLVVATNQQLSKLHFQVVDHTNATAIIILLVMHVCMQSTMYHDKNEMISNKFVQLLFLKKCTNNKKRN